MIQDTRYKYVHFDALPPLFFDLEADPGQLVNLARRPGVCRARARVRPEDAELAPAPRRPHAHRLERLPRGPDRPQRGLSAGLRRLASGVGVGHRRGGAAGGHRRRALGRAPAAPPPARRHLSPLPGCGPSSSSATRSTSSGARGMGSGSGTTSATSRTTSIGSGAATGGRRRRQGRAADQRDHPRLAHRDLADPPQPVISRASPGVRPKPRRFSSRARVSISTGRPCAAAEQARGPRG